MDIFNMNEVTDVLEKAGDPEFIRSLTLEEGAAFMCATKEYVDCIKQIIFAQSIRISNKNVRKDD